MVASIGLGREQFCGRVCLKQDSSQTTQKIAGEKLYVTTFCVRYGKGSLTIGSMNLGQPKQKMLSIKIKQDSKVTEAACGR